jgi:hypothetical protein
VHSTSAPATATTPSPSLVCFVLHARSLSATRMPKVAVHAAIRIVPARLEEFKTIFSKLIESSQKETGTETYIGARLSPCSSGYGALTLAWSLPLRSFPPLLALVHVLISGIAHSRRPLFRSLPSPASPFVRPQQL